MAASAVPNTRLIMRISNDLKHAKGRGALDRVKSFWRAASFRRIAARADKLVFVSRHLRDQANAIADVSSKSVVIPNGVDVAAVRSRAKEACPHPWLGNDADVPVVVAVGRLVKQKNLINLVHAVASAERPVRLLLIGSGPLREAILSTARARGIADFIDILESRPNPIAYMARAGVVALPSWWEGSSNVLLEAVACGTPVVASRTAGNAAEVLDNGRYGVLVDPANVHELARALVSQCGPSAIRPANRADAFSRDAMLAAYAELVLGDRA